MGAVQVIASLDNAAAGPSYSVRRLATALASRGVQSSILCTSASELARQSGGIVDSFPQEALAVPLLKKLYLSRGLFTAIDAAARDGKILHSHGLWSAVNLYPAWSAKRYGTVHLVSPRGMLGPGAMQFSRHRKRAAWWLAQRRALGGATCIHATSHQEHDELRAVGLANPIAIIPNGVDLPDAQDISNRKTHRERHERTLLHLGRIHPKKGIDRLIEAWARLEHRFPDWRVRIVGPSESGHGAELLARCRSLGLTRVTFEEPLYGLAKDLAFQQADLFVLPTLNENFGMVVAESLANATPVISSKGAPWSGLETVRAGWWIDHGIEPLERALENAMSLPRSVLDCMGYRGRDWMAQSFSWESISAEMEAVYQWCSNGGPLPGVVELLK